MLEGGRGEGYEGYDEKYDHENSRRENDFSGLRRIGVYLDDWEIFGWVSAGAFRYR